MIPLFVLIKPGLTNTIGPLPSSYSIGVVLTSKPGHYAIAAITHPLNRQQKEHLNKYWVIAAITHPLNRRQKENLNKYWVIAAITHPLNHRQKEHLKKYWVIAAITHPLNHRQKEHLNKYWVIAAITEIICNNKNNRPLHLLYGISTMILYTWLYLQRLQISHDDLSAN